MSVFSAAALRERLLAALDASPRVEVNLAAVSDIDSAGVQLLIAAQREAARQQKELCFSEPSAAVEAILDLLQLRDPCGLAAPAAAAAR